MSYFVSPTQVVIKFKQKACPMQNLNFIPAFIMNCSYLINTN